MFYVKDKVSKAKDGYEVAGMLKEKIGNEEGFFEFRMLKVEPYSKCISVTSYLKELCRGLCNLEIMLSSTC